MSTNKENGKAAEGRKPRLAAIRKSYNARVVEMRMASPDRKPVGSTQLPKVSPSILKMLDPARYAKLQLEESTALPPISPTRSTPDLKRSNAAPQPSGPREAVPTKARRRAGKKLPPITKIPGILKTSPLPEARIGDNMDFVHRLQMRQPHGERGRVTLPAMINIDGSSLDHLDEPDRHSRVSFRFPPSYRKRSSAIASDDIKHMKYPTDMPKCTDECKHRWGKSAKTTKKASVLPPIVTKKSGDKSASRSLKK